MLLSIPTVPVSSSSRTTTLIDRSQLLPSKTLPKHFNVPFAIQHGYFRCVRYLLELSADPNERDSQLRTPLILCSYVENDRWSLSLAQNLLEKGAKIALEDHARRNAMHHACALQRLHLVQLFLSCLDFKLEAKDCEGNTCLHYAAITGNFDVADQLMNAAEKLNVRLDQVINREGCSAAVLALKYGHIECANQITHRDWDEFFVIPRPLSIYESPPSTDVQSNVKKSSKASKQSSSTGKPDSSTTDPSTISFGLLKIIFNESDSGYSTRLAGICKKEKSNTARRRREKKSQQMNSPKTSLDSGKSTGKEEIHYCSTEALVNEFQRLTIDEEPMIDFEPPPSLLPTSERTSPRFQLLMRQYVEEKSSLINDDSSMINNVKKLHSKIQDEDNHGEIDTPVLPISIEENVQRTKKKSQRPRTAVVFRPPTSTNADGAPSRLSSEKTPPKLTKKKSLLNQRVQSASQISKQPANVPIEISTYSKTLYAGRPLSAVVQRHPMSLASTTDTSYAIREAKGASRRFNNPEELFGLKPSQLFTSNEHVPKMSDQPRRLKRFQLHKPTHIWNDDVDKLIELYGIHHSANYRSTAVPPVNTTTIIPVEPLVEINQLTKNRKTPTSKGASSAVPRTPKLSTLAILNFPRRNSISQRPPIKVAHT